MAATARFSERALRKLFVALKHCVAGDASADEAADGGENDGIATLAGQVFADLDHDPMVVPM